MASTTKPHRMLHPTAHDATPLGGHDQDVTAPAVDSAPYRNSPGRMPVVALPHGVAPAETIAPQRPKRSGGECTKRCCKACAARRRARRMRRARLPRQHV
jgi:hypothetical protein